MIDQTYLRNLIHQAFADVPYPGDDNIRNHPGCPECEEIAASFRGQNWRCFDFRRLNWHSATGMITPAAFYFFLPAFILADIDGQWGVDEHLESILHRLSSRDDRLYETLALLSLEQRVAVSAWLRYRAADGDREFDHYGTALSLLLLEGSLGPQHFDIVEAERLREAGQVREARDLLQRAAAREPKDGHLLHAYGVALQELSQDREAVPVLRKAVELLPEQLPIRLALGVSLRRSGELKEARHQLEEALHRLGATAPEAAPELEAQVHFELALTAEAAGEMDAAWLHLNAAQALFPHRPDFLLRQGEWLLRSGQEAGRAILAELTRSGGPYYRLRSLELLKQHDPH